MPLLQQPTPDISFQVTCSCGRVLTGSRQTTFQIVRCPNCGRDRFVLPKSPYFQPEGKPGKPPQPSSHSRLKLWLGPVLATIITATGLSALYLIFLKPEKPLHDGPQNTRSAQERLALAEKYLAEGSFRLAANELTPPLPQSVSTSQRRRWQQLSREASLLADLSAEPIEDILRHAAGVSSQEWQADFSHRYQGKALIFDIHIQRLPSGRIQGDYLLPGRDPIRIEWGDLDLFRNPELDRSQRMIFGARLAKVELEPPGPAWVVHFQPESGVPLTDTSAAALCCPPLGNPDALRVLEKQGQMVRE
jgi:hypothetical protein